MTTALHDPKVFGSLLATGTATAEPQADGTVVVRDVPLFAELLPDDPSVKDGMRIARDRAWLERALQKTQAQIAKGYKPPMTLRHHFDDPKRVGTFVPTKIVDAEVNAGEPPRATLVGDKVYESRAAFEESKDHDYRSVEVSPDEPDSLSALALLRDKAPFFRFPSLVERLAPEQRDAFTRDAFKARAGVAPQLWAGRPEVFGAAYGGAKDPFEVVRSMTEKDKKAEGVAPAIERGAFGAAGSSDKEASVADKSPDKGSTDYKAKFEAMMTKTFETMMAKCHAALEAAMGDGDAKAATAKAGGTEEPSAKKPDSAEAKPEEKKDEPKKESRAPDATPAVSQAAAGETFASLAEKSGVGLLSKDEKLELLGLRSYVKGKQAEEQVESFAAAGEKALSDSGVQVDAEIRGELRSAAKEHGKSGVDRAVAIMTRFHKNAARAPEAYGALAGVNGGSQPASAFEADVKKAVETFGARPGVRERIMDLAAQFREEGETFIRNLAPGEFFGTAAGTPQINPACMEARGGLRRGN